MKETQKEKILRLLRMKPYSTMELMNEYILAPQKIIQLLREDGYKIITTQVKGEKFSIYRLIEEPKQITLKLEGI